MGIFKRHQDQTGEKRPEGDLATKLRDQWGLGLDERGDGYRRRLQRLCTFLRELEPYNTRALAEESDFDRYERVFAKRDWSVEERESYIQGLEDLRCALEPFAKAAGKRVEDGLPGLKALSLPLVEGEGCTEREVRRQRVENVLGILGLHPAQGEDTLLGCLRALNHTNDMPNLVQECFADCAEDWEWAHLQVLVRLAGECLREKPVSATFCEQATRAGNSLEAAIPRMEKKGFLQYRAQGLYGVLAASYLARVKDPVTQPEKRLMLIERALTYARHAVEMEPESVRERLVLLEVLSTLEDTEELKIQAEIALNFDSSAATLRAIGGSFWRRATALQGRGEGLRLLREAVRFFESALQEVESAPFNNEAPLDQVQAHGWAHFWLGQFQGQRGKYFTAISHLRTASALGFKPIESRVELAWACWLARDRKAADEAFREAIKEATRQSTSRAPGTPAPSIAQEPGEERKIVELQFDAYVGWAFLCAEWDPDRALINVEHARGLLAVIDRPNKEELEAALDEACGRVCLHQGNLDLGIRELERAVKKSPRSGAYSALGLARLEQMEQAQADPKPDTESAKEALRRAREAYRLARESDLAGRYRREIWDLRCRLRTILRGKEAPPTDGASPRSERFIAG
jgi:tetratricopeptide (TPR) repeat protein